MPPLISSTSARRLKDPRSAILARLGAASAALAAALFGCAAGYFSRAEQPAPKRLINVRVEPIADIGIWNEYDKLVRLAPDTVTDSARVTLEIAGSPPLLHVLYGDTPIAVYPYAATAQNATPAGAVDPEPASFNYAGATFKAASLPAPAALTLRFEAGAANSNAAAGRFNLYTKGAADAGHGVVLRVEDLRALSALVGAGSKLRAGVTDIAARLNDIDGDGIPDQTDILLGGKKTVRNGSTYDGKYVSIPKKLGDVPRKIGVCTDVIIRSLRNAGIDLQSAVQADRKATPAAYKRISRPDANIDHRRVPNLVVWFSRHWEALPTDDLSTFLPGDVVFFDFFIYEGPDHSAIVSERKGKSGKPLFINNAGPKTSELDLLPYYPVLHHFRRPAP